MIQEELLKKIRHIELKVKSKVDSYLQGAYHTLFKGHGLEFQEVREYTESDDSRRIDWNVTARMGKPFVKLYREERELTVILVADISGSTTFGRAYSAREVLATLSAAIAFSAIRNNDKVGLLLFSDRIEEFIPPRRGRNHLLTVIRSLLTATPHGKRTVPEAAFSFLNKVQKKKALVFFLSDMLFEHPGPSLAISRRRHEIIPVATWDRSSYAPFGKGDVRVMDPETGEVRIVPIDSSTEGRWDRFTHRTEEVFRRLKMKPIWVENREDFINDLILGFRKMERTRR